SSEQTRARTIVATDRINAFLWVNHRLSSFAERRTRKQRGRVQKAIAKYSCDFQPGRPRRSSSPNVSTLLVSVTTKTARRRVHRVIVIANFCLTTSNALVQLQAHYHHCGEAASEKCLSAATFVRRQALRSMIEQFAPRRPVSSRQLQAPVRRHHSSPLPGHAASQRDSLAPTRLRAG